MSTKEYPLDHIQALHLLTGEEPVTLEMDCGRKVTRRGGCIAVESYEYLVRNFSRNYDYRFFRIYEPPAPPKLEPVELCDEVRSICNLSNRDLFGLIIAQAVRMAREEREAEKNK